MLIAKLYEILTEDGRLIFEKEDVYYKDFRDFLNDHKEEIKKYADKNGFLSILINEYYEGNECNDGYCSCGYYVDLEDSYYYIYFNDNFYSSEKNGSFTIRK